MLARFDQSQGGKSGGIQVSGTRSQNNVSAFIDLMNYDSDISTEYIVSRIGGLTEDDGEKGALILYTNSGGTDGSGLSEKVRITSDGRMGIGVTNPSNELEVARRKNAPAQVIFVPGLEAKLRKRMKKED